MWQTAVVM